MSAVRMCDRCGEIFSEREDGWASMIGSQIRRDQHGQPRTVTEQMDTCAKCTTGDVQRPRLALDSATGVDRIAKTQTQDDRDRILNGDD